MTRTSPGRAAMATAFALAASLFVLGPGCGGPSSHPGTSSGSSSSGGTSYETPAVAATGDDSGFAVPDGASPFTSIAPDGGGPLQVHVQINGNGGVCGACDVVLAQVTGGKQPYIYAWSDPSWQGPGPFSLCPSKATTVSVTATDSSAQSGEVAAQAQTAQDMASVTCTDVDGGDAGPGALNGCVAMAGAGTPEGGSNDAGQTECTQNEVEAGIAWADGGVAASVADELGVTLLKGHTYQVSYDRLLPVVLGQPVTVKIYGSTEPDICRTDQLLFTLNLDGSIFNWHQGYCFTPDRDYHYAVTNVYVQGVLVFFDVLSVSTICDSCSM
ncbi:MAG: hypothetical protein ACRENE_02710 [Polyangiaceae bacterium]